jgi:Beta-propeller repeat
MLLLGIVMYAPISHEVTAIRDLVRREQPVAPVTFASGAERCLALYCGCKVGQAAAAVGPRKSASDVLGKDPYPVRSLLAGAARLLCLAVLVPLAPTALPPRMAVAGPASLPLGWVTFLGGRNNTLGFAIAVDEHGTSYVTGRTPSADFPVTPDAAQPQPHASPGVDHAFVASYDAQGRLRWATYLGGAGNDLGEAIAVDRHGNVYVTGETTSSDFPVTPGAAQPQKGDGASDRSDAFVASYDPRGRVRWATYLGGKNDDQGLGIAVDGKGNVSITGLTSSHDFPVTVGATRPRFVSSLDAFVARYDGQGRLRWVTCLGGNVDSGPRLDNTRGTGIAANGEGDVAITGYTYLHNFPVTPGATQLRFPGSGEHFTAFVASYDPRGRVRWATYLGGSIYDSGSGIAVDGLGNISVTGDSSSLDFPVTACAAKPHHGGDDAFVASYERSGRLRWAACLGATRADAGSRIAADARGNVYVTGTTTSMDFPVTPGAAQPHLGGARATNAFVASYDPRGRVRWASYLGGSGYDSGSGIAVDAQATVYVTGLAASHDFPVTPGAAQPQLGGIGAINAFVARLIVPAVRPTALDPASPSSPGTPHARYFPTTRHTLAGSFLASWDQLGGIPTLGLPLSEPFTLAGQQVQVTERAVLVLAAAGQVSLLPLGTLLSAARIVTPVAPVPNSGSRLYFPSTGHTLSGQLLAYWQAHQGSTLLGAPISEPDREGLGDRTGRVYLVQWFTNGRLELHPEVTDPRYQVEQGRVGYEYLHRAGLL